jgi:hypothetical protein
VVVAFGAVYEAFVVCFLVWAVFHGFHAATMLGVGCVVGVVVLCV